MLRDRTFPTERSIERSVRNVQTSLGRRMQPATDTAESSPPRAIGQAIYSHGLHSYVLYTYGLYSYVLYSYGIV